MCLLLDRVLDGRARVERVGVVLRQAVGVARSRFNSRRLIRGVAQLADDVVHVIGTIRDTRRSVIADVMEAES
jgi:hypothetical protein